MTGAVVPMHELARRLTRSRTWHLHQAGRARQRLVEVELSVIAHEIEAAHCDELLREIAVAAPGRGDDGGGDAA